MLPPVSRTGLSPSTAGLPRTVPLQSAVTYAVRTPACTHAGLGSSPFARRYLENRFFFLFLRLLRCFSSPGSPPYPMDSDMDTQGFPAWVSPFRYLRINVYLPLPAAFRSLSRLSSALSAKASALCSSSLNHMLPMPSVAWYASPLVFRPSGYFLLNSLDVSSDSLISYGCFAST